jgi:iron complex outermembrane receptor protein
MKRFVMLPLLIALGQVFAADETTLKEITVTSGMDDLAERREAATQKVIINTKDIENMGALTVSDVMGKLPGVEAGSPGADGSMALRARGMMRDSVQMYIDGEKVGGNARMAQATVGRLPSTELERVEIVRGASAEFGGHAPVSVNLVFKKARAKDSLALKAAAGLRNDEPSAQFSLSRGGGDKAFSWMIPLTLNFHRMPSARESIRRDSAGLWQGDREDGTNRMKEFVFSPRLTWKTGNDSLTLSPSLFRAFGKRASELERSDYAIPANSLTRTDDERNRTAFNRLRADGEMLRSGVKYSGRLALSDGERRADVQRRLNSGALSTEQNRRDELDVSSAVRADWSMGNHALAASIEQNGHHRDESLEGSGATAAAESHKAWDRHWTIWIQDEWGIAKGLTLTGGLRGEFVTYASDGARKSADAMLPSIALRWEPAEHWVARSSIGGGMKAPRLDEITNQPVFSVNANSPIEADRRGNPNLRVERSVNFEAVLERYLPNEMGVFGANAYLRRTRDFIERRTQLEGARWVDRPYNEGTAHHWGMEFDGKLRADPFGWRGATFRAHLTLPHSRVNDERLGITRIARETPRYQLSGGYDQTLSGYSFGASFKHFGRVRSDVPGELWAQTKQRTVIDAYALRRIDANLNLRLSVQNLLKTDTRKLTDYTAGANAWSLENSDQGTRSILLSLEGKW